MKKIIGLFFCVCCTLTLVQLSSCSEYRHDFKEVAERQDKYIADLDALIQSVTTLAETSDFGPRKGQYPSQSRAILTGAVSNANRYVLLIKYQNPAPSEAEKKRYIIEISNAVEKFRNSVRTEDEETIPAELFVDGKTTQSYIDFGRSKDYTVFGTNGNQSFTVELWAKITENGPHDNSIFLATFFSNGSAQWRNGWMMYRRKSGSGIYRVTWGGILSANRNGLWEPSFTAPQDGVWQHFVFVYNDKGLDGNPALRGKLFLNGTLAATQTNGNVSEVYNSTDYDNYDKPMTGFCRWVNTEKMEEGFSGYMKKIRIWKEAKDNAYVLSSYEEKTEITGKETNLVAAWDFTSKPSGADNRVLDLTGKHEAKIVGTYKWEPK